MKKCNEHWKHGELTYKSTIYEFSHFDESEFLAEKTGLDVLRCPLTSIHILNLKKIYFSVEVSPVEVSNDTSRPTVPTVDWRLSGAVSPVKNQGAI